MKKFLTRWTILVVLLIGIGGTIGARAQGTVSFQVFYDELQPYGTWMEYGTYGYVWMPQADRDFVPYGTNGYWVNTEYGNTWVSDYAWGWAPFHYGRWMYDDFYGWLWIPGNEWAPAWVAWRSGGGYYGWAPLMPGMGISVSFSVYDRIPHHCWNFVPYHYITYRRVYNYCEPRPRVVNIIHQTTIVTYNRAEHHHTYFTGPSRHEMERDGRTRVDRYRVDTRNAPGRSDVGRGSVAMYRPAVQENTRRSAAPTRVVREPDMRRRQEAITSDRNPSISPQRENPDSYRGEQQNRRERESNVREPQDRRPQENIREQQNNVREQPQRREQENNVREQQQRREQENNVREQQQRREQENNVREQQQRREQENNVREQQQRREQENNVREQQQRREQENNLREQQQERQVQERRQQEQNRQQQQQQMREQQEQNRQQQQRQVREQQQQQQRIERREQPAQRDNGNDGGGSRRRRNQD